MERNKQCSRNVEIKNGNMLLFFFFKLREGGVPGIAKMPTKERHSRFQYATSSSSSVLNSVAAVKECHSTLHLYVSNCDASSVSHRGRQHADHTNREQYASRCFE